MRSICASTAHINMDENGAPERIGGIKLLQVPTGDGKLTPELIDQEAWGWGDEHRAQPLAVSITQTTELGTCYTPEEVRAIAEHVHSKGMKLHMDGARLANAAAHLGVPLRAFTRDAGVDILSFGGTKNGLLFGEVVVALNPEAAHGLVYLRKMNMQLASKMRFMSAQFIALLEGDLWLRSASHANAMAARLRAGVESVPGVELTQKTESNGVFAILPAGVADRLRQSFRFYDWNEAAREVRWMCSFDTTEDDVDAFIAAIKRELGLPPAEPHAGAALPGGEPAGLAGTRCITFHCELTRPGSGRFPLCPRNPSTRTMPQRTAPGRDSGAVTAGTLCRRAGSGSHCARRRRRSGVGPRAGRRGLRTGGRQ